MTCHRLLALVLIPCAGVAAATEDRPPHFEGAVGLVADYGPEYGGSAKSGWGFRPAGFVRYGRISVSGSGGFTTRNNDDVERGVAAELLKKKEWRVSLSGRWTTGRQASDSHALAGMGDIQATLLARLRTTWDPPGPWHYTLAVNADTLGHGSGWLADLDASRQWVLAPTTRLQFGASVSFGSETYMQSWYGVTPEQALRSGYAVYTPGNGLRDVRTGLTLHHELGPRWDSFIGVHASWQIGAAARSPIVEQRLGWSLGSGLVWRF